MWPDLPRRAEPSHRCGGEQNKRDVDQLYRSTLKLGRVLTIRDMLANRAFRAQTSTIVRYDLRLFR
jgi:hypothetical protein